ncbi:MAG TPA: fibronectin type III domain-containing protein [Verrucomicrobiae bacterium]|jgi:hypothetical protein
MATFTFDMPGVAFDQPGVTFDAVLPVPAGANTMAKVKLGLSELTEDEILELTQTIITSMTGNANFGTPNPSLATLATARTDAMNKKLAADAARATAEMKTTEKDVAIATLITLLTQEGDYVQNTTGGNQTKIESAGMATRAPRTPVGLLPAPTNLLVTDGGTEGKLELKWKANTKAKSYKIQMCTGNAPGNWVDLNTSTRAAYSAAGLASGTKYWFRVAAVTAAGTGGWSDPACKVAP